MTATQQRRAAALRANIAVLERALYAPDTPRAERADLSMTLSEARFEYGRLTGALWTPDAALDTPDEE